VTFSYVGITEIILQHADIIDTLYAL
jgi:hypothetical protein